MWNIRGIWSFFIRHVSTMFTLDWSVSPSVTEVNCQIKKAFNYEVMVWDTVTLKCAVGIVPMFQRSPSPAWLHTFWTTVAHCVHSVERGHVLLCQSQTPLQFGSSSCRRFCLTWKGRMHRSQKDSVRGKLTTRGASNDRLATHSYYWLEKRPGRPSKQPVAKGVLQRHKLLGGAAVQSFNISAHKLTYWTHLEPVASSADVWLSTPQKNHDSKTHHHYQ